MRLSESASVSVSTADERRWRRKERRGEKSDREEKKFCSNFVISIQATVEKRSQQGNNTSAATNNNEVNTCTHNTHTRERREGNIMR